MLKRHTDSFVQYAKSSHYWYYSEWYDGLAADKKYWRPQTVWQVYGYTNVRSDRMPVADHTNDGACKASYKWGWRRTLTGAEDLAKVLLSYLLARFGDAKSWTGVVTPHTCPSTKLDSDGERPQRRENHPERHNKRSHSARCKSPDVSEYGRRNSKSQKVPGSEESGASSSELKQLVSTSRAVRRKAPTEEGKGTLASERYYQLRLRF